MSIENYEDSCISHLGVIKIDDLDLIVTKTKERLENSSNLTLPLNEELSLLEQLTQFELGKFLLKNKGLDGYWIDYIISGDHTNVAQDSLEYWLLNHAPLVTATQERFKIFQAETQKLLSSDMKLVSVPCGAMKDLLLLDYSNVNNISLVGIDIDQNSINLVQNNIRGSDNNAFSITLIKEDAWRISEENKYNLITSNGLNIYESNEDRIIELYSKFYNMLVPGGVLITSFITKSPSVDNSSPWKNIDINDLTKQKALFLDIIQAKWQNAITETQMIYQLNHVGFKDIKIIYDSKGMFPTVAAKK